MTPERFEEIRNIIDDRSFVGDERGIIAIELFETYEDLRSRLADLEAKNQEIERLKAKILDKDSIIDGLESELTGYREII